MARDVIVACDFSSAKEVLEFLDKFENEKPFVKIGMELFYSAGAQIVRQIKQRGHKIFLDLKLCDIPNTVEKSMAVLRNLDVDMVNVHAFGTKKMMEAALRGLTKDDKTRPLIVAVTLLTSVGEQQIKDELFINEPLEKTVMHLAKNAKTAGLDGVVCSPLEAKKVKDECGISFITVTPGVRFEDGSAGDQIRVTTPKRARELGSDYIVVGRPITASDDPVAAYKRCVKEFLV